MNSWRRLTGFFVASLSLVLVDSARADTNAVARGREFLVKLIHPQLHLLPEFAGHHVIWLFHDNYLAAKVLAPSHPSEAARIVAAIKRHGVERSGKIEMLFGESALPFRRYELRDVATNQGFRIKSEFTTDEVHTDFERYADLLLLAAIAEPDAAKARAHFDAALAMWDGTGFVDPATRQGRRYATYKLALALRAARRFGLATPALTAMRERLRQTQADSGGWITDYRADGTPVGFANVETTSLAILALDEPTPAADQAARPNIIFVLADDMGLGDVTGYGGTIGPTPHLDRLAREGARFTRYYSASPICSPSRSGLLTGQFPARHRLTSYLQTRAGNRACEQVDFLDPQAPSLPRLLKSAGYATAHVGKWHLGGGRDVTNAPKFAAYGYDVGLGTYESPEPAAELGLKTVPWGPDAKREPQQVPRHDRTRWMVDATLAFLKQNPGQPCFVNLWLDDTHTPWTPLPSASATTSTAERKDLLNLIGVIAAMDRQIGRLMDAVAPNTLLIFATDNGALPTFGGRRNAGLRGSKLSLYEGGLRLPFIARWPGKIPPNHVDHSTVLAAVDLLPTLAALAGVHMPAGKAGDGENLSAALLGQPVLRTKPLFWEYGRNNTSFAYPKVPDRSPNVALREGRWKLLINADATGAELYDLDLDPRETNNLASAHPAITQRMSDAALAWRRSLPTSP